MFEGNLFLTITESTGFPVFREEPTYSDFWHSMHYLLHRIWVMSYMNRQDMSDWFFHRIYRWKWRYMMYDLWSIYIFLGLQGQKAKNTQHDDIIDNLARQRENLCFTQYTVEQMGFVILGRSVGNMTSKYISIRWEDYLRRIFLGNRPAWNWGWW